MDNLISKDLTKIKSAILSAHREGYAALYSINRYMQHSNLIKDEVETSTPRQRNSELFSTYVCQVHNFIQCEGLRKRYYTKWQTTSLTLKNLHLQCREQFMDKAEHQFKHDHDKTNNIQFSKFDDEDDKEVKGVNAIN
eukprot:14934531-Ditylum_brightwellii.AAC.1